MNRGGGMSLAEAFVAFLKDRNVRGGEERRGSPRPVGISTPGSASPPGTPPRYEAPPAVFGKVCSTCGGDGKVAPEGRTRTFSEDCEGCSGTGFLDDPVTPCSPVLQETSGCIPEYGPDTFTRKSCSSASSHSHVSSTARPLPRVAEADAQKGVSISHSRAPAAPPHDRAQARDKENRRPGTAAKPADAPALPCSASGASSSTFFAFSLEDAPPNWLPPSPEKPCSAATSSAATPVDRARSLEAEVVIQRTPGASLPSCCTHGPSQAVAMPDGLASSREALSTLGRGTGSMPEREPGAVPPLALLRAGSERPARRQGGGQEWDGHASPATLQRKVSLDVDTVRSRVQQYKKERDEFERELAEVSEALPRHELMFDVLRQMRSQICHLESLLAQKAAISPEPGVAVDGVPSAGVSPRSVAR